MDRGVKKQTYKNLKREITEETAINVGYYPKVLGEINNDVLLETIKEIAINGWINKDTELHELSNMIVTESVRNMGYQEFKDIADNFFSFVPDNKEEYYKATTLEVTRENYDWLVNNTNKAFGLEKKLEEIEKEINSLENKINDLETIRVKSNDVVIGVDIESEKILLLKSPENSLIFNEEIETDELITSYKSTEAGEKQIVKYLSEEFTEIDLMYKEYVLNNDLYNGMLDIDSYDIDEIDFDEVPVADFNTHKEYYEYATEYPSFNERYKDYEDYIYERFNTIYSWEHASDYSIEFLKECRDEIDNVLDENSKYIVTKDIYGYSQGEHWIIGYLADKSEQEEHIETYLENYVGAWYKGSLSEMQIINFEDFEKGIFNGEVYDGMFVDTDLLSYYDETKLLETIKEIYPELKNFKTKTEALEKIEKQEKQIIQEKNNETKQIATKEQGRKL